MKNIKTLSEKDAIHCSTLELFEKINKLNSGKCNNYWNTYKESTVYYPSTDRYGSLSIATQTNKTIHNAIDFLEDSPRCITTVKEYEIIECANEEEFEAIRRLSQDNGFARFSLGYSKENCCIRLRPCKDYGLPTSSGNKELYKIEKDYSFTPASEFLTNNTTTFCKSLYP